MIVLRALTTFVVSASVLAIGCSAPTPDTSASADPTTPGETGASGPTGATGRTGAAGASGEKGAAGVAGEMGPAGPTGATGTTGATGATGVTGAAGVDGRDGFPGVKGDTGDSGLSSLVNVTPLSKGDPMCAGGGLKIETGLDDNSDGTLAPSEVDQTSYACQAVPRARVSFVTSQAFDGNLGGVAGGDAKCQAAAAAVPELAGKTFKAWLSDASTDPSRSFTTDGTFVNTHGAMIAESWADFRDTTLMEKMFTESGAPISSLVWTGTDENGWSNFNRCNDWTSASSLDLGLAGNSDIVIWYWSYWGPMSCNSMAALYCIEQ